MKIKIGHQTKKKEVFKMKSVKANVCEFDGCAVTVDIAGNIEEYAQSFLHIFNNVRESNELFKVRNYYGDNYVTVYCESDSKEALLKYLKSFGEIKSCEKVVMYRMEEPEFDIDKYYDAVLIPDFD